MLPCRREHRFHKITDFLLQIGFALRIKAQRASKTAQKHPQDLQNLWYVTKRFPRSIQNPEIGPTHTNKTAPWASWAISGLQNYQNPSQTCQKSRPDHEKLSPDPPQTIKNHSPHHQKPSPDSEKPSRPRKPLPKQLETIPMSSKIYNHSPRGAGGRGRTLNIYIYIYTYIYIYIYTYIYIYIIMLCSKQVHL